MTAPTEPWYFRTLADDLIDTVRRGYELDPANIVGSLRSAADQIDHLTAERDQARQMLANAPHEERCLSLRLVTHPCTCWKAGL